MWGGSCQHHPIPYNCNWVVDCIVLLNVGCTGKPSCASGLVWVWCHFNLFPLLFIIIRFLNFFYFTGEAARRDFVERMPKKPTTIHTVDRDTIFSSVIAVFQTTGVEDEFPLRIKFKGERGVDIGGVYRDMVSLFWKAAFEKVFDGGCLLTPVLHPNTDLSLLPVIGKIISHGYLSSGFLPVKMAFPTLASLLLQSSEIDDDILMSTFIHAVSAVEAGTLSRAFVLSRVPC